MYEKERERDESQAGDVGPIAIGDGSAEAAGVEESAGIEEAVPAIWILFTELEDGVEGTAGIDCDGEDKPGGRGPQGVEERGGKCGAEALREAEDEEVKGGGSGGVEEGEGGVEGAGSGPASEERESGDDVVKERLIGIAEGHAAIPTGPPYGVERVDLDGGGQGIEEGLDGIATVRVFLGEEPPGDQQVEGEEKQRDGSFEAL